MSRKTKWSLLSIAALVLVSGRTAAEMPLAELMESETGVIVEHLDQGDIDAGAYTLNELFEKGKFVFSAAFNRVDGQGRPASTGGGVPRFPDEPAKLRTSGPDSDSCAGCHAQPRPGGSGDFVANVFVLAQELDPVTFSVDASQSNDRNTLGMMGSGPIEMLAREMSTELQAIRDQALQDAAQLATPVTVPLVTKGVFFGTLTAQPNGQVDPSGIEGVDWDLIIKPFHQKGAVVSLRQFTNNAMNHHHGMQSTERFGQGNDEDLDDVVDELTEGDITAVTLFQAALNVPGFVVPLDIQDRFYANDGRRLFGQTGCARCHKHEMALDTRMFTEPNPFNPSGNLTPDDVSNVFSFDMTTNGEIPRIQPRPGVSALVRPFTDLKRHNLNDADFNHFDNEQLSQGSLLGFADPGDFTIPALLRPTDEFLTRKLWEVGNSAPYGHRGDLSTITEAIYFHGGDARVERDAFFALTPTERDKIVQFLKTMQVVPPGSAYITFQ